MCVPILRNGCGLFDRGLGSIAATLLASDGDVRLQCKAANALGSLCMSEDVADDFISTSISAVVLNRYCKDSLL